jgi:hypothetical protein
MSNIWAENDGVMSMRIGKKEPKVRNSTFTYFIDKTLPKLYQENKLDELQNEIDNQNENLRLSAVVEKIILDNHGRNKKINLGVISNSNLLGMELACSDYMNIKNTKVYSSNEDNVSSFSEYLPKDTASNFNRLISNLNECDFDGGHNVFLIDEKFYNQDASKQIISKALDGLGNDGFIIIVNRHAENNYKSSDYSHTVGTRLKTGYDIPHYSDLIFDELKVENENRGTAVQVIHKKDNV